MTGPITPERLAELREHYDSGIDDALEGLLELMATGHDGWLTKGRANWAESLKAYQADHVALLAEVERMQDDLAALQPEWAVACGPIVPVGANGIPATGLPDREAAERAARGMMLAGLRGLEVASRLVGPWRTDEAETGAPSPGAATIETRHRRNP